MTPRLVADNQLLPALPLKPKSMVLLVLGMFVATGLLLPFERPPYQEGGQELNLR